MLKVWMRKRIIFLDIVEFWILRLACREVGLDNDFLDFLYDY